MKIIVFPFAGGNRNSFNFFKPQLQNTNIEIIVLEYPGRRFRLKENLLESINQLIDAVFYKIANQIEADDYIIYGHSMGALIGYLVCQRIEELQLKKPLKLIVSGRIAPSVKKKDKVYHLPTDLFWEKVYKLGGIPKEILKEEELKVFFEPILRADFKVVEEYRYNGKANLTIPIDVIYGSDENIEKIEVIPWERETNKEIILTKLNGNHFFIYDHVDFFINLFKESFNQLPRSHNH